MAEEAPKDQQEKQSEGEEKTSLQPRPSEDWDALLTRADVPTRPAPPPPAQAPGRSAEWQRWLRAASPLLVLVVYFAWKAFSGGASQGSAPGVAKDAETLSGQRPVADDSVELNAEAKEFVERLETLRSQGDWRLIATAIQSAKPSLARHPVMEAFGLIARTRMDERSVAMIQDLKRIEVRLGTSRSASDLANLIAELRTARAAQMLRLCEGPQGFRRNTDEMTALLSSEAPSRFEVEVRIKMAELGLQGGATLMKEADEKKFIGSDPSTVAEARALYQQALRFVVTRQGWARLEPISPQATATVGALVEKMREANGILHGISNPLGGYDSNTWSGLKGGAIHDNIQATTP